MSNNQNLRFRCAAFMLASSMILPMLSGCQTPSAPVSIQNETSSSESPLEPLPESSQSELVSEPLESQDPVQESSSPSDEPSSNNEAPPVSRTLDVKSIYQFPELPTGCEITALTMALRYAGYPVSKTTMAKEYLPKSSNWYYVGTKKYGPDSRTVFSGDPFSDGGCVCFAPVIVTAANDYLAATGGAHHAVDLTGSEPKQLYDLVLQGTPVVVFVTIEMVDRTTSGGWYIAGTEEYLEWSSVDHCAVLVGVDEERVILNDPITGRVTYSKARFESVYKQRGKQAVILTQ